MMILFSFAKGEHKKNFREFFLLGRPSVARVMTGSLASPLSPGSSAPEKWRGTEGRKDISEKLYRDSWNKSLAEINMYVCTYI